MKPSIPILALILLLLFPASAVAEPAAAEDADSILAKVDRSLTVAEDFTATLELKTTDASGATEERTMTVWQKGQHRRMIKLTAPARLRGVGLLAMDEGQLYIFLPAFGRVRRVAGAQRGEPFLGSNFTQDDFSRTVFAERFRPSLSDESKTHWTLKLMPRDSDGEPYGKMVIQVRKEDHQVSEILFFDKDSDRPNRRLEASDFRTTEEQTMAFTLVAEDLETKSRSRATLSDVKVNTGLRDNFFTQRQLQR